MWSPVLMMKNYGSCWLEEYDEVERIEQVHMMKVKMEVEVMLMEPHVRDSTERMARAHMLKMISYRMVVLVDWDQFHSY